MPEAWNRGEFAARPRPHGWAVVPSDAFAVELRAALSTADRVVETDAAGLAAEVA